MTSHSSAAARSGFHHLSFFLDSWHDILKGRVDVMAKNRVKIDIAPTRHGITRGETIYFFDPSGNRKRDLRRARLSGTAGPSGHHLDRRERRPAPIFYHTGELSESFTTVYT